MNIEKKGKLYNTAYYNQIIDNVFLSASEIVPKIIESFNPKSVIDVGCGIGAWLKAFDRNGIKDYLGIDGEYILDKDLLIDKQKFLKMDLTNTSKINRKFDIAISLEVAEHIELNSSHKFIDFLAQLSDIIIFSAAIPGQGGTYHINEQWPEFWQKEFLRNNFIMIDLLRSKLINNPNILWWYKQNIFVFIKKDVYQAKYSNLTIYNPDFILINKTVLNKYTHPFRLITYHNIKLIRNSF